MLWGEHPHRFRSPVPERCPSAPLIWGEGSLFRWGRLGNSDGNYLLLFICNRRGDSTAALGMKYSEAG